MRMASVNITIPDQLLKHAKGAGLNISKLTSAALSNELNRLSKLAQFDAYLAELEAELGPVDPVRMAALEKKWNEQVLVVGGRSKVGEESFRIAR
jgi:hypothetical protein